MPSITADLIPIAWLVTFGGGIGLCAGSFLNVVIGRLPRMLEERWEQAARAGAGLEPTATPTYNLSTPASHCPACGSDIAWHDNVPVLGYLKRRGKCAGCNGNISLRYPLIEAAGGLKVDHCTFKCPLRGVFELAHE